MDAVEEQEIIAAVLAGDINTYSVLVQHYQKPIFNLMYRVTGSYEDALDLAQETFIKAYEKLDSFRMGARFFPWLYTIGFNHARNFIRKAKISNRLFKDWGEESELNHLMQSEEEIHKHLNSKQLNLALRGLPFDYREALVLYYHEGFSIEDVAAILQLSVSGAKMRVHRGIKKLRQIIFEEDDETERLISAGR